MPLSKAVVSDDVAKRTLMKMQLIGAIDVGGAQKEQCAHHALTKVLGPQPPLTIAAPATGAQPAGGGRGGAQ
jgi:hypothetical protein